MNSFTLLPDSLVLPEKTLSGCGSIQLLAGECRRFGSRGLILHGAAFEKNGGLKSVLDTIPEGMTVQSIRHEGGEPTLQQVSSLIQVARQQEATWIAGIGGGSIMDLAKATAALVRAPYPPVYYHDGGDIPDTGIVFIAAPTTAGTGAEATLNSVLTNTGTGAKKSIRSPGMMARLVILDPDLLAYCPKTVIAASGMDALTQAIEAYTSRNATWLSDTLALEATQLIAAHLEAVHNNPRTPETEPLLTGSYLAGIALSFARLGIVHGLAHPLGALYHVPHGSVCAACLPHAIELNRQAFGIKYDRLGQAMGGDLLTQVRGLLNRLGFVSPFSDQTLVQQELIIRETLASGSTKANPKPITKDDVEWLLARLFS